MEYVKQQLLRITSASKTGARVVSLDNSTLALYDCFEWDERCHMDLLSKCPSVGVSIRTCPSSLSHFVIVIHSCRRMGSIVWGALFGLALAGVCYALSSLSWS